VSAKTADGVEEAFMKTAASIWEKMTNGKLVIKGEEVPPHTITLSLTVTLSCTPLDPCTPLDSLGPPWLTMRVYDDDDDIALLLCRAML